MTVNSKKREGTLFWLDDVLKNIVTTDASVEEAEVVEEESKGLADFQADAEGDDSIPF